MPWRQMSWAKRLGSAGVLVGFIGATVLVLAHPGLRAWAARADIEWFGGAARQRHPTGGLLAVGVGVAVGIVGFAVGWLIDKSRPEQR